VHDSFLENEELEDVKGVIRIRIAFFSYVDHNDMGEMIEAVRNH
jgi:hypothetical protein